MCGHERTWEWGRESGGFFSYEWDINSSSVAVFQVVSILAKTNALPSLQELSSEQLFFIAQEGHKGLRNLAPELIALQQACAGCRMQSALIYYKVTDNSRDT